MSISLEEVVPWGRSFDEYVSMFSLTQEDLEGRILGCGDGPAAFNAELTRKGGNAVSIDPLYTFCAEEIESRIRQTYAAVLKQVRRNESTFVWNRFEGPDALGRARMEAMRCFLADYACGRAQGRYVAGGLPDLALPDKAFDLALCSHFLFLYSDHTTLEFHIRSAVELCRVAHEVRIFPLLDLTGERSVYVDGVVEALLQKGYGISVERVDYEFQKGGDHMLRIRTV
ncbi:SAM-dependent methyltransferase [Hydrogenimonas sp.]